MCECKHWGLKVVASRSWFGFKVTWSHKASQSGRRIMRLNSRYLRMCNRYMGHRPVLTLSRNHNRSPLKQQSCTFNWMYKSLFTHVFFLFCLCFCLCPPPFCPAYSSVCLWTSGHPSCLDMSEELVSVIQTYRWQCMECKTCTVCRQPHHEDEMMFCDKCDRGYHTFCVGMDEIPTGEEKRLCVGGFSHVLFFFISLIWLSLIFVVRNKMAASD